MTSSTLQTSSGPVIVDDKSPHCIPFILSHLSSHSLQSPLIIGLNGLQGAGKTTLVTTLSSILTSQHNLEVLVFSIDDLYLTHSDQVALAESHPDNPLIQHRGEPGTHDMVLAREVFESLKRGKVCKVPEYDKSAYNGSGDRVAPSDWKTVNRPGQKKVEVVIFEGWCVGFSPLSPSQVKEKQKQPSVTLQKHTLENLLFINENLKYYEWMNVAFDLFIHLDAEDTTFVYDWRREQEVRLWEIKGRGMTTEQVDKFVDGYFPAYELFLEGVRRGIFQNAGEEKRGKQLRLIVGKDRAVKEVIKI